MVIKRLLRFSMVRVAITAGTLQPKPISMGTKDFPCSPMRRNNGSAKRAARDK